MALKEFRAKSQAINPFQKETRMVRKVRLMELIRKPIVVRIMDEGSGGRGKSYYRVSIDGKGSLTSEGIISSDRGLTHIDLSENSMSEITNIINNYLGRK